MARILALVVALVLGLGGQAYAQPAGVSLALRAANPCARVAVRADFIAQDGGGVFCKDGQRFASFDDLPGVTIGSLGAGTYLSSPDGAGKVFPFTGADLIRTNLGAEVWEARTNLLLWSSEMNKAGVWGNTEGTITLAAATAPNGTLTANSFIESGNAAQHYINQSIAKAASPVTYTASIYLKQIGTARNIKLTVNDGSGNGFDLILNPATFATASGPSYYGGSPFSSASASGVAVADGWVRVWVTFTSNSAAAANIVFQTASGTTTSYAGNGSGFYLWNAQLEAGSFPTPGIVTAGSAVTRAAANVTLSALQPVFSSPTGWAVVVFKRNQPMGLNARMIDATGPQITTTTTGTAQITLDGGANSAITANALTLGARTVVAASWDGAALGISMNGGAVATGTYALGTVATPYLGNRSALDRPLNGQIERIVAGVGRPPAALNVLSAP